MAIIQHPSLAIPARDGCWRARGERCGGESGVGGQERGRGAARPFLSVQEYYSASCVPAARRGPRSDAALPGGGH